MSFHRAFVLRVFMSIVALGFQIDDSNNVLHSLTIQGIPLSLTRATVAMFAYAMLVPSIPVSLIISSNNLAQNHIMPKRK